MPALTCVVPTYNRLPILKHTVARLLAQGVPNPGFQVVVVDDGSDDGTYEWLESQDVVSPTLMAVRNPAKGRASARNAGIAQASGHIICFVDDDMQAAPGFIAAHIRAHATRSAGERPRAIVGKMRPWPENHPTLANTFYDRRLERIDDEMADAEGPLSPGFFCTGNVSVDRERLGETLFDPGFNGYSFEDTDLGYQFSSQGTELWYAPDALAYHWTDVTVSGWLRKQSEAGRTAVRLLRKWPVASDLMSIPFEIPGVPETVRNDSIPKTLAKSVAFSRIAQAALDAATQTAALMRWHGLGMKLMERAGYCRYGRAYRMAARELR